MKGFSSVLAVSFILFQAHAVEAAIQTQAVEYMDGDAVLQGYLAYDDSFEEKRPGILVVHEWTGLGDYVKKRCEDLAQLGYVAFGADIYGKGIRPQTPDEAGKTASIYKNDRALMRRRAQAALDVLKNHPLVDDARLAAIGYCFGGTTVLELARSGAYLKGVVSFHGGLDTPNPDDAKNIKAKVLALHGADDPFAPQKDVLAFQDEMRKAGVDWHMTLYGGAVHSFTNPNAGDNPAKGAAYNESADRRSWRAMRQFFDEIFEIY